MDLGSFGSLSLDPEFLSGIVSIVLIDLILAGDNAVVIAMAVRALPKAQRRKGILFGASAAVLLRVIATFFVSQLLNMRFVKLGGGLVILWIAFKLFVEDEEAEEQHREAETLWHAVKLIVIADITMSLDNMLAVGGAAQGNLFLLLFGLGLSIPFIVVSSTLLERLMEKYPVVIYLGAALLGKIGGEMIMTDPYVTGLLHPPKAVIYVVEALCAAGIIVGGRMLVKRDSARQTTGPEKSSSTAAPRERG
jgi:YjbE family integral membrane protein